MFNRFSLICMRVHLIFIDRHRALFVVRQFSMISINFLMILFHCNWFSSVFFGGVTLLLIFMCLLLIFIDSHQTSLVYLFKRTVLRFCSLSLGYIDFLTTWWRFSLILQCMEVIAFSSIYLICLRNIFQLRNGVQAFAGA